MTSFRQNESGTSQHLICTRIYIDQRHSSASPPPTYDSHGRRTNTREVRYRKKLEDERIRLVDRAMKNDPNFRPPVEYHQQKRSQRPSEKVYIPVKEFPEINFFGLLVGPRGNSLKKMERDSGAKISIRGKGSVKEGKARPDQFADDAEEDLHCLVVADSEDKVASCVRMINKVIETVCIPSITVTPRLYFSGGFDPGRTERSQAQPTSRIGSPQWYSP